MAFKFKNANYLFLIFNDKNKWLLDFNDKNKYLSKLLKNTI